MSVKKTARAFVTLEAFVAVFIVSVVLVELFALYVKTQESVEKSNQWLTFFRESKEARQLLIEKNQSSLSYKNVNVRWRKNEANLPTAIYCEEGEKKTSVTLVQVQTKE